MDGGWEERVCGKYMNEEGRGVTWVSKEVSHV